MFGNVKRQEEQTITIELQKEDAVYFLRHLREDIAKLVSRARQEISESDIELIGGSPVFRIPLHKMPKSLFILLKRLEGKLEALDPSILESIKEVDGNKLVE